MARVDENNYTLGTALASGMGPLTSITGGEYALMVDGTLGSVTGIALLISSPDGAMVPASNLTGAVLNFTTLPNSVQPIHLPRGNVRISLTGTGGSINAQLVGLG
jgi:hypothetical protein